MRWLVLATALLLPVACADEERANHARIETPRAFDPPAILRNYPDPPSPACPNRIVCLVPSVTEEIFALGLGDRVVGVDRWADQPSTVKDLPRLGDITKVNTEAILDLRPDLVVLFDCQSDAREILESAGVSILIPPTEETLEGSTRAVAQRLGVPGRATHLLSTMQGELEEIRETYAERPKPRVLLVFERTPRISVATSRSFYAELLDIVGAKNVSKDAADDRSFAWVSTEQILDWRPEVIVDLTYDPEGHRKEEAIAYWKEVLPYPARVLLLDAPVLARPGPRIATGARFLARCLHGE